MLDFLKYFTLGGSTAIVLCVIIANIRNQVMYYDTDLCYKNREKS